MLLTYLIITDSVQFIVLFYFVNKRSCLVRRQPLVPLRIGFEFSQADIGSMVYPSPLCLAGLLHVFRTIDCKSEDVKRSINQLINQAISLHICSLNLQTCLLGLTFGWNQLLSQIRFSVIPSETPRATCFFSTDIKFIISACGIPHMYQTMLPDVYAYVART